MISRQLKMLFIVACGLAVCAAGPAMGQLVGLDNGLAQADDGHLSLSVDAYGSWSAATFGGGGDLYNPIGGGPTLRQNSVMFSNGFILFRDGAQRELLSESVNWQNVFAPDASLEREITIPNALNGNTASSQFRVHDPNGNFDVTFDVAQSLSPLAAPGAHGFSMTTAYGDGNGSTVYQTYTPTNNSGEAVWFEMVRAIDADMLFGPGQLFNDDEVGTDTNGNAIPGTSSVYQFDTPNPDAGRVTITAENTNGGAYYAGVQGVMPGGVEPAYAYGTDTQVWDAFGVPTNWRNNVANVGYDTDGQSGPQTGSDAFTGLEYIVHIPEPTSFALISLLSMGLLAFRRRIA